MLSDLHTKNKACTKCDLRGKCNQVVTGQGPSNAHIMVVGEAPGEDEDLMDSPFIGRAGKQLDEILKAAKIDRASIYVTNAVKCRPHEQTGRFTKNRPPTPEEVSICKGWLWQEIKSIKPKAIVTLGKTPTALLLSLPHTFTLSKIEGKEFHVTYTDAVIVPTYHPSFLMQHGREKVQEVVSTFNKVREYVENITS